MRRLSAAFLVVFILLGSALPSFAQEPEAPKKAPKEAPKEAPKKKLIIGTKTAPPFSYKENGEWKGISIELWEILASELKVDYEWKEASSTNDLVEKVASGEFDVGIAAITMKPDRAKKVDFSNSVFKSGVVIAARRESSSVGAMFSQIFSLEVLELIGSIIVILFLIGVMAWFFERKKNPEEFGGTTKAGLWEGFWWSAVTMTTVGYGDKAPKSVGGRILALFWMFTSIIMISAFTAAIASSLTTQRLQSSIRGPEDLAFFRVGAKKDESPVAILAERGVRATQYASIKEGLAAVHEKEIDAFVHDLPVLQYEILNDPLWQTSLTIVPKDIQEEEYGIAFHPADKTKRNQLREDVNVKLLEMKISGRYAKLIRKYLGN